MIDRLRAWWHRLWHRPQYPHISQIDWTWGPGDEERRP